MEKDFNRKRKSECLKMTEENELSQFGETPALIILFGAIAFFILLFVFLITGRIEELLIVIVAVCLSIVMIVIISKLPI